MRSRTCGYVLLMLSAGLLPLSGCSRAIKQVYYEFRGAKAKIHPIREVEPAVFGQVPEGSVQIIHFIQIQERLGDHELDPG